MIAGSAALLNHWRESAFAFRLPANEHVTELSARLVWFSVLVGERSVDLCRGTLAALESDLPFSAATCGRSEMELVGQVLMVEQEVSQILTADPIDVMRLDRLTRRALAAMPHAFGGSGVGGYPVQPGKFVAMGETVFGAHFRQDYEYLSALVHPAALVVWTGDPEALPPARTTEGLAELLIKVVADGGHAVMHSAQLLMDRGDVDVTFPIGRQPNPVGDPEV